MRNTDEGNPNEPNRGQPQDRTSMIERTSRKAKGYVDRAASKAKEVTHDLGRRVKDVGKKIEDEGR